MSTSNTANYAANSSAYLDSLVNYVLDIKPYHTKLAATGAVAEGYLFSDSFNVGFVEADSLVALVGADLLPAVAVPGGGRARISQSWWHDIISDSSTYTWPLPQVSVPMFASEATLQNFVSGTDDIDFGIGLPLGVFNPKRWDGPGITDVERNGIHQQDTIHYVLSYGFHSIDIITSGVSPTWIERDLDGLPTTPPFGFSPRTGALAYKADRLESGTIANIVNGNYEE